MNGFQEKKRSECVLDVSLHTGIKKKDRRFWYYVYVYLDPRRSGTFTYDNYTFEYEPFYVGKGKGRRIKEPHYCNSILMNKIRKIKREGMETVILKIESFLSHSLAVELEKKVISAVGRKDLKKGPLLNLTDGGQGVPGRTMSEITKIKIGNANRGRRHFGRVFSEETRRKISEAARKRPPMSEEVKLKISISKQNISKETREKMSKAAKKRMESRELRNRISLSVIRWWEERKLNGKREDANRF